MNVFEAVKQNLTTRQAAELYGIQVNRHGMAVCPFHNDKNPSMKVDKRFHCFACQADGDAVDFVSRCSDCQAGRLLSSWLMILASVMTADRSPLSVLRYGSLPRNRKSGRKKTTAFRCCLIISIFSAIGKNGTHRNSQRTNGIHCLWKLCKEKAISNICWIFFCWANRKKRKLLYRSNEKR